MRRAVLIALLALTGCGNERTAPPDVETPAAPRGERTVRIPAADLRFRAPGNWPDLPPQGARAGGVRSGRATVAVWHYPRTEPLPDTRAELSRVRELLLERIERRDPRFRKRTARIVRRGGRRAIEIVGSQVIGGFEVKVRSTHVFARRSEVVVDAYAPPRHFAAADRSVFLPLVRSLRFTR